MEMIFPFLLRIIFVESKRMRGASRYELCTLDPNVPATLLLHKLFFLISSPFGHTSPLQGTFWAPPLYHLYHSLTISDILASFQRRPLEIRFFVGINSPERTIYLGFKVSKEAPTPLQCCSFENRFKSVHAIFKNFSFLFHHQSAEHQAWYALGDSSVVLVLQSILLLGNLLGLIGIGSASSVPLIFQGQSNWVMSVLIISSNFIAKC